MNHPHIIALSGFATAGKDAVGTILVEQFGFVRVAFADEVRAEAYNGRTLKHDVCGFKAGTHVVWSGRKDAEGRRVLQAVGEDARLEDENYWLRKALDEMDRHDGRSIAVTDCRYHNEWTNLRDRGGINWRIVRTGIGPANAHISEREHLWFKPFTKIHNHGTLEDLAATVVWHMADLQ